MNADAAGGSTMVGKLATAMPLEENGSAYINIYEGKPDKRRNSYKRALLTESD